jgi:glutathione synthase/RimK-type ligase-like ATP-grasp enzyme
MKNYSVLIVFRRHVESFAHIPYLFKEASFQVHLAHTCFTRSIRFSKNADAFHSIPYDNNDFAACLLKILKENNFDFVFFADEPALTAVCTSTLVSEYSRWLPFPIDSPIAATIGSKVGFQEFMEAHQLRTPKTYLAKNRSSIETSVRRLGYPCVIKASKGSSGNNVFILRSEQELETTLHRINIEGDFVVQEFIQGKTIAATFLAVKGRMKCHIIAEKTITLYSGKGPSVAARFVDNEEIREMCRKIAQAGSITGITGLDLMIDNQGRAYGIDPHFGRMTTHIHFGTYCGVHFGWMLRECIEGKNEEKIPESSLESIVKYPEFLTLIFDGGLIKLFKEFPPYAKNTHYLIKQPNENALALALGILALWNGCRCVGGRWKKRIFGILPIFRR